MRRRLAETRDRRLERRRGRLRVVRASERGRAHRAQELVREALPLLEIDGLGKRVAHDPLARLRVDAEKIHERDVAPDLDRHARSGFRGGPSEDFFLRALLRRDEARAGDEPRARVVRVDGVELLRGDVPRDELDRARDDVLALGALGAAGASIGPRGGLDHGVVHAAPDAQADRLDELLLAQLDVLARVPRVLLPVLRLLERRELGHDGRGGLVVVRVPDVHRRVRLRRRAALARHRGGSRDGDGGGARRGAKCAKGARREGARSSTGAPNPVVSPPEISNSSKRVSRARFETPGEDEKQAFAGSRQRSRSKIKTRQRSQS